MDRCTAFSSFHGTSVSNVPVASTSGNTVSMKIYDWKRRSADESALNDVENSEFSLGNLRPAPGRFSLFVSELCICVSCLLI